MRLSAAFLILTSTVSAQRQRALFDAAKMERLVEAEKNRMTVNGVAVESPEEIEAEVDAIVAMYEENEGSEETNDDFNFNTAEYTVNDIEFFAAVADDVPASKSAKDSKTSKPRTAYPTYVVKDGAGKAGKAHTKSSKAAYPTLSPSVSSSPSTSMEPTMGKAGKSEETALTKSSKTAGKAGKSEDTTLTKSSKAAYPTLSPTVSSSPSTSMEPSMEPTTSSSPSTSMEPTMGKAGKSEDMALTKSSKTAGKAEKTSPKSGKAAELTSEPSAPKKSGKSEEKKKSGKSEEKKKSGKSEEKKKSGKSEEKKKKSGNPTLAEPSFSPTFSPTLAPTSPP